MRKINKREFSVIVERDTKGYYVASVEMEADELRTGCEVITLRSSEVVSRHLFRNPLHV